MHFAHAQPFGPEDRERVRLRRQWAILIDGDPAPKGFVSTHLAGGLLLHHHADLRVEAAADEQGGLVVLGLALDPLRSGSRLGERFGAGGRATRDQLARELVDFGGMYCAVRYDDDGVYLYTDPGCMMQVFYARGRAASTPSLLPDLVRDAAVDREFPLRGADDWYPGSLVPYEGVRALLANHELDVARGTARRFWPTEAPPQISRQEGLARAAGLLRGMVESAAQAGPLLCSLTGGRDSRVVLAATRPIAEDVDYFTIRASGVKACDLEIPRRLAERHGLRHGFVEAGEPAPWLTELYDEMTGALVIGAPRQIADGCRQLAGGRYIHLNGNLGAITKSFFWPGPRPRTLSPKVLAKEFVNKAPCIREGIDEWVRSLPELPPGVAYNLMYLEQRGGRYSGIRDTASGLFFESCAPFNHRLVFDAVCGMPEKDQWGGKLLGDFVGELWPELQETPYCRVTRNWGTYIPKPWKERIKRVLGRA